MTDGARVFHHLRNENGYITTTIEIFPMDPVDGKLYTVSAYIWLVGCWELDGTPLYGERESASPVPDRATADLRAYIKWDGCNEWTYPEEGFHFCDGANDVKDLYVAQRECLKLAHRAIAGSGVQPDWEEPT